MAIRSRVGAFLALPRADRALLVIAWLQLWTVVIGLRVGLPWEAWRRRSSTLWPGGSAVGDPERIYRLVHLAARYHVCRTTCLERALCLERILTSEGFDCRLRFGVRRLQGTVQGHAWVEVSEKQVGENPARRGFVPMEAGAAKGLTARLLADPFTVDRVESECATNG